MSDKSKIISSHKSDSNKINYSDIIKVLTEERLLIREVNGIEVTAFTKLETDSRKISANDVFICIKGFESDGHLFAPKARESGADLFIVQHVLPFKKPQIVVSDSRRAAALLARLFFDDPTSKFKLVGITGTNGKTTVANITENILQMNNVSTGLIGTLGYSINGQHFVSDRTTPDIIDLNRIFVKMVEAGVDVVVMEVSSHSLALERVYSLRFAIGLFTNLTQDHLDFHIDLENYADSKFILFEYVQENNGISIVNIDDFYGKSFFDRIFTKKIGISYEKSDFKFSVLNQSTKGSNFNLQDTQFYTNLIGKFNIFNVAAAIAIIKNVAPRINEAQIKEALNYIQPVKGRLQRVEYYKDFGVYVDYAHTPDALSNVLGTLRSLPHRRLLCVFGAGGGRDKSKRPKMLDAVLSYADFCIITNDNPRSEKPEAIINDIVNGADLNEKFWIIRDRKIAIETMIQAAQSGDLVLIAGKGHETYQEINGVKTYFDDIEVAASVSETENDPKDLTFPIDPFMLKLLYNEETLVPDEQILEQVSTDSRSIGDNQLFFALVGENFDGHNYVNEILKNNSCWAVVNKDFPLEHPHIIRVEDTLQAYGRLAAKYRFNFSTKIIAITGSIGKTTTKEYLTNILAQVDNTLCTYGNENNLIGVPKTIFKLRTDHEYAVIELGTNQFGEIQRLTEITHPDLGIITSIGASHLEFLINEENVFNEKTALFNVEGMVKFFPADDNRFSEIDGITFGSSKSAVYNIENIKTVDDSTEFLINDHKFSIPTPYQKFTLNAMIAVAVCRELGIPASEIQTGLQAPFSIAHRMEITKSKNRDLLLDCYNANPDSMQAALDFWASYETAKPHVAILGDMLELGEHSQKYHSQIAEQLSKLNYKKLISVGPKSKLYKADLHYDNVESLMESDALNNLPENSVILLKASHSIHLEKIIERL
jgi:MurE/MurF fusion protein